MVIVNTWTLQKALPVKHKAVHWLNLPPLIMTCFYFISSFLSEKLRKRLFIHKNLSSLQESIPVDILPKEYGGHIPWKQMSDSWIDTLASNRTKLLKLDLMKWDESKAPSKTHLILPGNNNVHGGNSFDCQDSESAPSMKPRLLQSICKTASFINSACKFN